MVLRRAKNITLQEVGGEYKAGRSFHLGNLTIRDLLPVLAGCHGEVFDLNTMADTAYFPGKIIFENYIYELLLDKSTHYTATSVISKPPLNIHNKDIQIVVSKAFETSKTLGGFWMRINEELQLGEFIPFSQKIINNRGLVQNILEKVTNGLSNQELPELRSRYILQKKGGGELLLNCTGCQGDVLVYSNGDDEVRISKSNIVQESMRFITARSELTKEKIDYNDVIVDCHGPLFSNEMNALLIYLVDVQANKSGQVFHVGGQAMYNYIRGSQFSERFKKMLEAIDDDHDIMNGIQLDGMEIVPAHFFRMAGYDAELLYTLKGAFQRMDNIDHMNKEKGNLFKQGYSHIDEPIKNLINQVNEEKKIYNQLLQIIANHPEIGSIPPKTMKEGALYQIYHSQLDLYHQMSMGFDPKKERSFLLEQSIDNIKNLLDDILVSYRKR